MRENGAYTIVVTKSMGRAAFRFIDAPYSKDWFVDCKMRSRPLECDSYKSVGIGCKRVVAGYRL